MIHQSRARKKKRVETGGSETKRLIIVERASRVNVTSRNNLGREHVNAKSGVRIVRRGENRGNRVVGVTPFRSKSPVGITLIPGTLGSTSFCVKLFVSVETRRLVGRLEPLATRIAELDYVSRVCPVIYLSRRPPRGVLRFQHLLTRVFTIMRITQGN